MIEIDDVQVEGKTFQFIRTELGNAPLLILKGKNGYAMCGYLNIESAEKLGDSAVRVTGVKTLDDLLNAKISDVTSSAQKRGIGKGQVVRDILDRLA
ncbi:MAG: YunC family protein [Thermoplasmata archaeon]